MTQGGGRKSRFLSIPCTHDFSVTVQWGNAVSVLVCLGSLSEVLISF